LRTAYLSKGTSIGDVPIGVKELCVVEYVESFGTKLKFHALSHRHEFVNSQVQISRAWAAAYGARRVADLA
jgi:hypothetical protein